MGKLVKAAKKVDMALKKTGAAAKRGARKVEWEITKAKVKNKVSEAKDAVEEKIDDMTS